MIKEFSMDDFMKCRDLFIEVFNGPPWHDEWTNETASAYLQELTDSKRFLGYTLWDDNVLLGVVLCHRKNHYRGDEIFIDEMYISSKHQRKGYGTRLMEKVEMFARENSFINITLLTSRNTPAFDFYEKYGCKDLGYLSFMYKHIV